MCGGDGILLAGVRAWWSGKEENTAPLISSAPLLPKAAGAWQPWREGQVEPCDLSRRFFRVLEAPKLILLLIQVGLGLLVLAGRESLQRAWWGQTYCRLGQLLLTS